MPKLLYISTMRLPTEKAHGLQIMQNCEAFAAAGCDVTLWVARRWNTRALRKVRDPYAFYGIKRNFRVRRVPCIDLFPLLRGRAASIAFYVQILSFALVCAFMLPFARADIFYSRDELILWLLGKLRPRRKIAYEAHQFAPHGRGGELQARAIDAVGSLIAITQPLRRDLIAQRRATPERSLVAHDGVRRGNYEDLPTWAEARRASGWDADAFIVGYVGRLQTLGLDKGLGFLCDALAEVAGAHLALVGGPDELAEQLRARWQGLGLPPERFLYAGAVESSAVPVCLRAFDVCAMPLPPLERFAFYASPLKLFEYMAAGRAIVASDLPSWANVVKHDETALLLPPDDAQAWTEAICRLRDDDSLRRRLGEAAREQAMARYCWDARAERILAHIQAAR